MVDEYLSVPTFYGSLPMGDELALAANPTLVVAPHRRVGRRGAARRAHRQDGGRAARRRPELYEQIARLMGLEP